MPSDPTDPRQRRRPRNDRWSDGRGAAVARIAHGLVVPETDRPFRLTPEARVFCLGCCFARSFGAALAAAGARVTSLAAPKVALGDGAPGPATLADRRDPVSIRQELDWAAGNPLPEAALLPSGDLWIDPFLADGAAEGTRADVLARHAAIAAHRAQAFRADLVLLSLGQAEVWFDRRTRLALAGRPARVAREADPGRFGVKRIGYDEAAVALKGACALIRGRAPAAKIVLAVSPVPLARTWMGEDIIVANTAGKSVLHAAALALAGRNEGIAYFPAFEAVTASDPARAWEADRRSVAPEMLARLADAFMRDYGLVLTAQSATAGRA